MTHRWPVPDKDAVENDAEDTLDYWFGMGEEQPSASSLVRYKTLLGFNDETSLFRPWNLQILRWLVLETLGRSLFTTVLIADLFVRVNSAVWSYGKRVAADPTAGGYDRLMGTLERILNKS